MVQMPAGLTVPRSPSSPAGTRPSPARRCRARPVRPWARGQAGKLIMVSLTGAQVPLTGAQYDLSAGDYRATVTELGAGLRRLEHRGRPSSPGTSRTCCPPGAAGQLLCPWPNRVDGGHYAIDGAHYQLDLREPANENAIHGLTRWSSWTPGRARCHGSGHPPASCCSGTRGTRSAWNWTPPTGWTPTAAWRSASAPATSARSRPRTGPDHTLPDGRARPGGRAASWTLPAGLWQPAVSGASRSARPRT